MAKWANWHLDIGKVKGKHDAGGISLESMIEGMNAAGRHTKPTAGPDVADLFTKTATSHSSRFLRYCWNPTSCLS